MHQHWFRLLPLVLVGLMMALRFRRMGGTRRLRLEHLWIVPAILGAFTVFLFIRQPPVGLGWAWTALAVAGGAGVGWWRGKLMRISVDPATQTLNQSASPAAIVFLIGLFAVRIATRSYMMDSGTHGIALVTDLLMAFVLATLTAQRLEMYLRARRLLATTARPPLFARSR
jgi:hypothetical protein